MIQAPEGMIPVEDFARKKGVTTDKAITMIKEGFYVGRKIGDDWFAEDGEQLTTSPHEAQQEPITDGFSVLFNIIGFAALLGSIAFSSQLWPEKSFVPLPPAQYLPSILLLFGGIAQMLLFIAVGRVLTYLKRIDVSTNRN